MLVLWFVAFVVLTALTQIGGIILLLATVLVRCVLRRVAGWRRALCVVGLFLAAYGLTTVLVVPRLAILGGRVPLPCTDNVGAKLAPASSMFCLLNRNYVTPDLAELADSLAGALAEARPGTVTRYLDASFPFVTGFPLLPHLSHDNGRALDLALWYRAPEGDYLPGQLRSPIGYGAFEQPRPGDPVPCEPGRIATLRWNLSLLQPAFPDLPLDEQRTRAALEWLVHEGRSFGVQRVFIEPHLAARLKITSPLVRFQGCRAARHDDHIHVNVAD